LEVFLFERYTDKTHRVTIARFRRNDSRPNLFADRFGYAVGVELHY
jgi:hypothetical protein